MTVTISGTDGITTPGMSNSGSDAITGNQTVAGRSTFATTIGVGNATPSTSGAGITFPATQSASTDVNTLDDYEEGTWTPTVNSATGSITTYTASATYTKTGRVVCLNIRVTTTSIGTAGGYLRITNLPFSADVSIGPLTACGRETNTTGFGLSCEINSASTLFWQKYDGTFLGANGYIFAITAVYFV